MKYEEIIKNFEIKTHSEKVLKAELDAIITTLNHKQKIGDKTKEDLSSEIAMRSSAINLEETLSLIITYRKYIENPEKYKLNKL